MLQRSIHPARPYRSLGLALLLLAAAFLTVTPLQAQEAQQTQESRFQVQIGSSRDIKGTKWFAAKASQVLGESTYVLQRGEFYAVLTGYYQSQEQAAARLVEIRKHYNGMVVSYTLDTIHAAFRDGEPITENELLDLIMDKEHKRVARQKAMETQQIRSVDKDQATGLRRILEEGLRNVRIEGCTLVAEEKLAEIPFRSSVPLAELDPHSLQTREKHGENLYLVVEARNDLAKVTIEQLRDGKAVHSRKTPSLSLRLLSTDDDTVQRVSRAFQELIGFCGK